MTTILPVSNSTTNSTSGTSNTETYNQFLKLLVTQMQYQDPLNPQDPTQFTSQLAQFNAVEQQLTTNKYLAQLVAAQNTSSLQANMGYIGKDVVVQNDQFAYAADTTEKLSYSLSSAAVNAKVVITDAKGNLVKTLTGDPGMGAHSISWDGTDDYGSKVASGNYKISVTAPDSTGASVGVSTYVPGTVTSVTNNGGTVSLLMGDIAIDPSKIIKITNSNSI